MNIGKILGVASSQHIILRCTDWLDKKALPEIGDAVFDAEKKRVGNIADIFGPVTKPFISVQLMRRGSSQNIKIYDSLHGSSLFTLPSKTKTNIKSKSGSKTRQIKRFPPKKVPYSQSSKFKKKK
ncbi:hypothetical protein NEF87_001414 [Candidatus Lokiarchaeum ossiferum]|uniref:H/ACA RNA-protein complex component Gar1 n=1 Tax=Candidatus Lokiarchaeum ossiferum TaxID=2951803 RepID=A0ABY6HNN7_9ARCH|nr:hypothetical protein NEF87_001414 [Candidatus Lokiarchaeum sp. B-35]